MASPASSEAAEAEASSTIEAGADHLQAFTVEPVEGEPAGAESFTAAPGDAAGPAGLGLVATDGGFISRDAFFEGFKVAFNVGASIPPYIKSLAIAKEEEALAREAASKLYDICIETPALHFLVKPGGIWFERVAAIGAFALIKGQAVATELHARKAGSRAAASGGASSSQAPAGQANAYDFAPKKDAA